MTAGKLDAMSSKAHPDIPLQALLLEDKRPLDGYGTSGQPDGALIEWPFEAKNQLYYDRSGMQLSETEKADQVQVHKAPIIDLQICISLLILVLIQASLPLNFL